MAIINCSQSSQVGGGKERSFGVAAAAAVGSSLSCPVASSSWVYLGNSHTLWVITAVIIINYPHILGRCRRGPRSAHECKDRFFLDQPTENGIMQKLGHLNIRRAYSVWGLLFYCRPKISVMMAKSIVVAYKNGLRKLVYTRYTDHSDGFRSN